MRTALLVLTWVSLSSALSTRLTLLSDRAPTRQRGLSRSEDRKQALSHRPAILPNRDSSRLTDGGRRAGVSNRKRGDEDSYRFVREKKADTCRYLTLTVVDADNQTPLDGVEVSLETPDGRTETRTTVGGRIDLCLNENREYLFDTKRAGYQPNLIGFSTRGFSDNQPSRLEISLQKNAVVSTPVDTSATADKISSGGVSKLHGVVRGTNGQPLEGIAVTLRGDCGGSVQRVITGRAGRYEFFTINGCDYTLEAAKVRYVANARSKAKPTKKVVAARAVTVNPSLNLWKGGNVVTADNIYYNYGQMNIRPDAARELDKLVATLKKNPQLVIALHAHTDSRGDAENNRAVSQRRANEVADYLALKGIARWRMKAKGYGESMPINECKDGVTCTEAEYQKNRRTEFKIIRLK